MNINNIIEKATNKENFSSLQGYFSFCKLYLDYAENNIQAVIVSKNENQYHFYQYKKEADFQLTRPINSTLMYNSIDFEKNLKIFINIIQDLKNSQKTDITNAIIINNIVYTIQQSIGAALDALPAGKSNSARKLNGDLFEQLIRLLINELGINCRTGIVQVPVIDKKKELFTMSYQHDLIVENNDEIKVIGSVKTSSKDRLDKIFIDKFLFNKLKGQFTPHIAIFLNDVQRKKTKKDNEFAINSTFLSGHFKGYTVKLNPLDGVYYCDLRPNMKTDPLLKKSIKSFDNLLINDIWKLIQ